MKTDVSEKIEDILRLLDEHYPFDGKCFLHYSLPHELLVATILSAQCTDDRVNIVTADLFKRYKTVEDFATADPAEMESQIRSTGFYHNKAKNIIMACQQLLAEHDGQVPGDIDKLTTLAGVGRKTANVVRGHIYGIPGIAVDTHVKRVSKKLGLTENTDPVKIEHELYKLLPEDHWISYNSQIIAHGRAVCMARSPRCEICFLRFLCSDHCSRI